MKTFGFIILLYLLSLAYAGEWGFEISSGTSFKAPNTLILSQDGYEDYSVTNARYETKPFSNLSSLAGLTENYYSVRIRYSEYELEWLHDKAYYVSGNDPQNAIQHFEISDGLNLALFNVVVAEPISERLEVAYRVGFGAVISNPASVIRGQEDGTRTHLAPGSHYYLSGVGAQASAQLRYYLTDSFALTSEIRYVVAHTNTPIYEGFARSTFNGVHINFGILFR